MQIGRRIFYDQDGNILFDYGELSGEGLKPRDLISQVHYVDLPFGSIDYSKQRLVQIDPVTQKPILEEIPQVLSPEEQKIKELEDALLLTADAETGGIL